jgi:HEPN domain-containing protein
VSRRAPELARATLRKARVDLRLAELAASDRALLEPWAACFHAQQAAEKAIKAVLIEKQVEFPRTHDLERLRRLLPEDAGMPFATAETTWLTDFAAAGRYALVDPASGSEPDWADADRALEIAREAVGAAERTVRESV